MLVFSVVQNRCVIISTAIIMINLKRLYFYLQTHPRGVHIQKTEVEFNQIIYVWQRWIISLFNKNKKGYMATDEVVQFFTVMA